LIFHFSSCPPHALKQTGLSNQGCQNERFYGVGLFSFLHRFVYHNFRARCREFVSTRRNTLYGKSFLPAEKSCNIRRVIIFLYKLLLFRLAGHVFFWFWKGIFLHVETFLRGFRTLLWLQENYKSFIWGRENLDRHLKIPVKKGLHEVMKLSGNGHSDLFILVKPFPMIVLLQNTAAKLQAPFLPSFPSENRATLTRMNKSRIDLTTSFSRQT